MNSSFSTVATSEPTPGQPKLHTWDKDDQNGNWGRDVLNKIPGNANDSPGPKQEKIDKDELLYIWKASEFWNYVDSQLEEHYDEICNLLLEKDLQDEKFA